MEDGDARIRSHKDLDVWRRGMTLARSMYQMTDAFPKKEEYRLTSQIIRAAISIPANIAEGNARGTRKDYAHFISIARGSAAELETLLLLAQGLGYVPDETLSPAVEEAEALGRMLNGLRARLNNAKIA